MIDPYSILESLEEDTNDLFVRSPDIPDEPIYIEAFEWHQSDYIKIADAMRPLIWENTFEEWNIYYLSFNALCQDNLNGFSLGDLYYFKSIFLNNGKIRYSAQEIQILPQYGRVIWGSGANFPRSLLGWKRIALDDIKVSAEDAFKIADQNGGEDARSSVQNACSIQVRLSGYDEGWKVRISDNSTVEVLFSATIDFASGEIK